MIVNNNQFLLPLISSASVLRKEKLLKLLIENALKNTISSVKIYETLLQTYLFAGFPSALISLKIAGKILGYRGKNKPLLSIKELQIKGTAACKRIYGDKYEKLIKNVSSFSTDLSDWLITEGYGKVLSRKSLGLKQRELCIISILASMKYEEQLISHLFGAARLKIKPETIYDLFDNLKVIDKSGGEFGLKLLNRTLKKSKETYSALNKT
jgi:4-carboxymuconolactone decarboxylase